MSRDSGPDSVSARRLHARLRDGAGQRETELRELTESLGLAADADDREVARALVERRDLVVITNNLNVVGILSGTPGKELILAGGIVRQTDGAIVGDEAVAFIRRFKADFAVIGASALDEDGAIMDYDLREVAVSRAIVENARRTILVCDRLKFERSAPIRICSAADIHAFVTDAAPPPAFVEVCARAGVAIEIAAEEARA